VHAMAALPPAKNSGTHQIGGWVGTTACVDDLAKRKSCSKLNHNASGR